MTPGEAYWNAECDIQERLHNISDRTIGRTWESISDCFKEIYEEAGQKVLSHSIVHKNKYGGIESCSEEEHLEATSNYIPGFEGDY